MRFGTAFQPVEDRFGTNINRQRFLTTNTNVKLTKKRSVARYGILYGDDVIVFKDRVKPSIFCKKGYF